MTRAIAATERGDFHRMLGGFLEVETERKGREAFLHFRLRDVMGQPTYTHTFTRDVKG
ncbi:MAG TPA: hypothetical protein VFB63_15930 [Bryobacteraceae bacterium]|nr:hypothetical protein [Bryobacteraceae bacterium]